VAGDKEEGGKGKGKGKGKGRRIRDEGKRGDVGERDGRERLE
jgi:hypothetical protein